MFAADAASPPARASRIEELATASTAPDVSSGSDTAPPLVLFDGEINRLRGWSHLRAASTGFPMPRFALPEYAIDGGPEAPVGYSSSNLRPNEPGPGRVFHAILVKRLGDWDRNHLNGIEPLFTDTPLRLGEVEAIVVELRFDSARSSIPPVAELASRYAKLLSAEQLAALDNGRGHLGVSVFEAGFNDHDRSIFGGAVIVEFDPARHFDRWLRVTIPVEALEYYFEKNYARIPAERSAQLARELVGLRINPESSHGQTVRHSLRESFGPHVPETLKEMALAIRRLEIRRRR